MIDDALLAGATIDLHVVDGRTGAAVTDYHYELCRQLPTYVGCHRPLRFA